MSQVNKYKRAKVRALETLSSLSTKFINATNNNNEREIKEVMYQLAKINAAIEYIDYKLMEIKTFSSLKMWPN